MNPTVIPSWYFNYRRYQFSGMCGYLCGDGEHGVEITAGEDGLPVTRPMTLNLEHYYALSCADGMFVPRAKAKVRSSLVDGNTVRIEIEPFGDWAVYSTVTYRPRPDRIIEAIYSFRFLKAFSGFEVLISNYFHEPTEPFIHFGGAWNQPKLRDDEHRFWPRGPAEAENIRALYQPETTTEQGIERTIDRDCFDHPIMVTPIRDTGYSVVNIMEREHCCSLSANRRWCAHDFSLLGRDVEQGETVTCRTWLAYRKLESLDEAIGLYDELI
jgi:hypothetical protein